MNTNTATLDERIDALRAEIETGNITEERRAQMQEELEQLGRDIHSDTDTGLADRAKTLNRDLTHELKQLRKLDTETLIKQNKALDALEAHRFRHERHMKNTEEGQRLLAEIKKTEEAYREYMKPVRELYQTYQKHEKQHYRIKTVLEERSKQQQ